MALYFICGSAGTGKSTVLNELRRIGYEAYDVDEAGPVTAKWHNDHTGYVHPKSSVKATDRTPEFLATHSWKVPRDEAVALAERAAKKSIFLGGSVANEQEIADICTKTFTLSLDEATLRQRLAQRTNNDWGKSAEELAITLSDHQNKTALYQSLGYTCIDASQATEIVVQHIIDSL